MAILAGGLAFVGTAQAVDVIIDGNLENTTGSGIVRNGGTANPGVGGGSDNFQHLPLFNRYANPGPPGCGIQFLRPYAPSQSITQSVSLTATTTPRRPILMAARAITKCPRGSAATSRRAITAS